MDFIQHGEEAYAAARARSSSSGADGEVMVANPS